MTDTTSLDFEMVYCPKCGTANSAAYAFCRQCDEDLTKSKGLTIPLWVVGVSVGLVGLVFIGLIAAILFDAGPVISLGLITIGVLLTLAGNLWFLFEAFRENVLWGLACIFIPLASLVFLFLHAGRAFKPFLLALGGVFVILLATFVATPF